MAGKKRKDAYRLLRNGRLSLGHRPGGGSLEEVGDGVPKTHYDRPGQRGVCMASIAGPENLIGLCLKQSSVARRWSLQKSRRSENHWAFQLGDTDWLLCRLPGLRVLPQITWVEAVASPDGSS